MGLSLSGHFSEHGDSDDSNNTDVNSNTTNAADFTAENATGTNPSEKFSPNTLLPQRSKFGDILENVDHPILSEVLSYLHVVSIVDKQIVCVDWKNKCQKNIDKKGREVKQSFSDNTELCDEVGRYCCGDRDDIEKIAEEYGYPIGRWDVSRVEDFSRIFLHRSAFNENISSWDVGNGKNMEQMFGLAESFDQDLSGWNVSNVQNMRGMFSGARSFDEDLSLWDTSSVTHMDYMFFRASNFSRDVSAWDTSNVTHMERMFSFARKFKRDLSKWDVSRVVDKTLMFDAAVGFNHVGLTELWLYKEVDDNDNH